jgi:hypothetical protein
MISSKVDLTAAEDLAEGEESRSSLNGVPICLWSSATREEDAALTFGLECEAAENRYLRASEEELVWGGWGGGGLGSARPSAFL